MISSHAISNGVFFFRVNRVGSEEKQDFYGNSFCVSPEGELLDKPTGMKESIALFDVDLKNIERARKEWAFLKDRRPETYKEILTTDKQRYPLQGEASMASQGLMNRPKCSSPKREEPMGKKKFVKEYLEPIVIAVLIALFIRTFVVQAFKIPSSSMEPTLLVGDYILVNKFIYGIRIPMIHRHEDSSELKKPQRGDVIVFIYPKDQLEGFIKRVIATEGEKVDIVEKQDIY